MASKKKCANCGKYERKVVGVQTPKYFFCSDTCAIEKSQKRREADRLKRARKQANKLKESEKAQKRKDREKLKALMTRSQWFDKLQKLVNQEILIRDEFEPCCTCGTTNPNIKYDAGHFIAVGRGGVSPIRFEPTNIHKQCSVQCNQYGSGMRAEYRDFIVKKYGQSHLDWLEGEHNHKPLKEQFPAWQDIEQAIIKQREVIRKLGHKPRV